jgi:hypothetical protein
LRYRHIKEGTEVEARQITNKDMDGINYDVSETAIYIITTNGKTFYSPGDYLVTYSWGATNVIPCEFFEKEWRRLGDST